MRCEGVGQLMKQIFATLGGCEGLVTGDCIYGEVHAVPCQIFFYGGFAIGIDCVSGPRPCELGDVVGISKFEEYNKIKC